MSIVGYTSQLLTTSLDLYLFWKIGQMHLLFILLLLIFCSCKFDLKPGTKRNKLFSEYGTDFRYMGEIKNGLDGVSVVTSIPIPRFKNKHVNPIHITNCSLDFNE